MSILHIDLEEKKIETLKDRSERGYKLLKELSAEYEDSLIFLSSESESLDIEGASNALFSYNSPLSGKREYDYSALLSPFVLLSFGYSALVIKGRASNLSYISVRGSKIEIKDIERGLSFDAFSASVKESEDDIVIGTSLAADEGIKISAAYENSKEIGRSLGYAFSLLNLKGLCFQNYLAKRRESDAGKKYIKALEDSHLAEKLKRDSTSAFIKKVERMGALPIENFERRYDARAIFLDGSYLKEKVGVYSAFCRDCRVQCRRVLRDGTEAPSLVDALSLGSNQNIFSADKLLKLKKAVFLKGLDTVEAGAMLSSFDEDLDEKMERIKEYSGEDYDAYTVGGKAILFDIRGMGEGALFLSLGDDHAPLFSIYGKKKVRGERMNAILALYERALRYGLTNRGYPMLGSIAAYMESMPSFAYISPILFSLFFNRLEFFSIKAKDLLREGLEIINELGEAEYDIPDHFIYTSSDPNDNSTVNITRLKEYYRREKARLENKLFKSKAKRKGE